jgi:phosphatidylserine/phosphatidylglycerophosphate/cardiolipin synthase-like enzyme
MKRFTLSFTICLLILACQFGSGVTSTTQPVTAVPAGVTGTPGALTDIPMQIGYGVRGPWFELYFTDPTNAAKKQETGGPDGPLVASLDSARVAIDMAAYSLNLKDVESALLHAQQRGVQVRLVMESDNTNTTEVKALQSANIPIVGDHLAGLMHNKFVVIDRAEVWTGSMNYTQLGTYSDNNNLMHIRSTEVADDYETEFDQMFVDHKFGSRLVSETPHPSVTIDGTPLNIYFSPADHIQSALLPLINNAQSSIYFLAYSFTSDPLGNAIRQRAAAGVKVAGVMETDQVRSDVGTEYDAFRKAGLDVHLDGNPGLMHHKVFIIDNQIVAMGSYNFTASAEKSNDENLIVINNPDIAAQYMKEFQRVYAVAQP